MFEEETCTLWCGNLSDQVTEELLYELFLQAGPLESVKIIRERDGRQRNFAFITFAHEVSVPYAVLLFRGTSLFQKALSLKARSRTVSLPAPIRASTLHPQYELKRDDRNQYNNDIQNNGQSKLTLSSLRGDWTHRSSYTSKHDRKHGSDNSRRHHGRVSKWRGDIRHSRYGHGPRR